MRNRMMTPAPTSMATTLRRTRPTIISVKLAIVRTIPSDARRLSIWFQAPFTANTPVAVPTNAIPPESIGVAKCSTAPIAIDVTKPPVVGSSA
jgi:hypothetical protein